MYKISSNWLFTKNHIAVETLHYSEPLKFYTTYKCKIFLDKIYDILILRQPAKTTFMHYITHSKLMVLATKANEKMDYGWPYSTNKNSH